MKLNKDERENAFKLAKKLIDKNEILELIDDIEKFKGWEEVPDEDLWEDGELNLRAVQAKIIRMMHVGKYKLIRKKL